MNWIDNHIEVVPPKKPKKITGTHFATVLGINPYNTPFEAWCRCTRTYEIPFEGNKFTSAGQVIEPKVFDFLRNSLGFGNKVVTPEDVYGKDHFKRTWGDFFPDVPVFGGSWDALIVGDDQRPEYVVEIKTVYADGHSGSLDERWKDGEAPHYQALQASLYAYLLGIDKVLMVAVPLYEKNGDYDHPEQVVPSYANGNVYIDEFRVSERYPNFDIYFEQALTWWNTHVLTGISPDYDETSKKDIQILKALRTNEVPADTNIDALIAEAEALKAELEAVYASVADKEKRLKAITEQIKKTLVGAFRPHDIAVEHKGDQYIWSVSKNESSEIDKAALEADGLLEKYTRLKETFRINTKSI